MASSSKVPIPANFGKRGHFRESIEGLRELPENQQWEVIDKVVKDSKDFTGFRHHAAKTQSKQDHHLSMFKTWMFFKHQKEASDFDSDDDLNEFLFPSEDQQAMCEEFRQFLIMVFQRTDPRSRLTGTTAITYRSLSQYRDSLAFWARRVFRLRGDTGPSSSLMFGAMTEAMRAVVKRDGGSGPRLQKAHIGLAEMRQLIDAEMLHNSSIEVSEQHMAAWTLLRATACRPGSICLTSKQTVNPPLKWKDIEITRGDAPGQFDMTIHFWNIHIKKPIDAETQIQQPGDDALHVHIKSPYAENLIFSPAHRLLVIALRRGAIADGIDTIEALLNGQNSNISFKAEYLDQPLFYRSKPKGAGLDVTEALRTDGLTDYLKRRAYRLGWNFDILGMTAFRRRALTDIVARLGTDAARRIAGHSPDSTTLERYYLFVGPMFDQTSLLMEQPLAEGGYSAEHRKAWAPLAMGRIDDKAVERTRGRALNAMVDRMALADENPPADALTNGDARRQYRKRLRLHAHRALRAEEQQQAIRQMTTETMSTRKAALDASSFSADVLKRAFQLHQLASADATRGEEPEEEEYDEYGTWEGFADSDGAELEVGDNDAEGDVEENAESNQIVIEPEVEMLEEESQQDGVSYLAQAQAFMELIMNNKLNQEQAWSEKDKRCHECLEDPTVDEKQKAFQYRSAHHLGYHLDSNFHQGISKFERAATAAAAAHPEELFSCVYCEHASADIQSLYHGLDAEVPPSTFQSVKELAEHVNDSNAQTHGRIHDELKDLDGWYNLVTFPRRELERSRHKRVAEAHKNLKNMGIEVRNARQVAPDETYPHFPGIVYGIQPTVTPPRFATAVVAGPPSLTIPAKFDGLISKGLPQQSIPPTFQSSVAPIGAALPIKHQNLPAGVADLQQTAVPGAPVPNAPQQQHSRQPHRNSYSRVELQRSKVIEIGSSESDDVSDEDEQHDVDEEGDIDMED